MKRSKVSDLGQVKKLNCWACGLEDISALSLLPNVEVLTLSVNKIRSLEPLRHCHKLAELYIRNNQIVALGEIGHLRELYNLRILWLENNPCAFEENYRLKVLKYLPMLHKLDNAVVTEYELDEASRLDFEASCQINGSIDNVDENSNDNVEPVRLDAVLIESSDEDEIEELTNRLEELKKQDFDEESLLQTKEILAERSIDSDRSASWSDSVKSNGNNQEIIEKESKDFGLCNDDGFKDENEPKVVVDKSEEYDKMEEISFKRVSAHDNFQRFSIEETNKLRVELGLKPRTFNSVKHCSSVTSVQQQVQSPNVLSAILCLMNDLNKDSLDMVIDACKQRREALQDAEI